MTNQTQPDYVEYGSRVAAPVPVECRSGRMLGLVLKGEQVRIEELCQRVFNVPAAGAIEYVPVTGHVLMPAGSFGGVSSLAKGYLSWGYVEEAQLSLWLPLAAGHREGAKFAPKYLCMATPFMFVDNPLSYEGGREDYGYSKAMGQFDPKNGLGDLVTVEAFAGVGPSQPAEWAKLLELSRVLPPATSIGAAPAATADTSAAGAASWRDIHEIVPYFAQKTGSPDAFRAPSPPTLPTLELGITIAQFIEALLKGEARQVLLKQFRDSALPGMACYQAVVEAKVQAAKVSWRPSLEEWKVAIETLVSHPIAADIGVSAQSTRLSFELQMDMRIEPGVIVAAGSGQTR